MATLHAESRTRSGRSLRDVVELAPAGKHELTMLTGDGRPLGTVTWEWVQCGDLRDVTHLLKSTVRFDDGTTWTVETVSPHTWTERRFLWIRFRELPLLTARTVRVTGDSDAGVRFDEAGVPTVFVGDDEWTVTRVGPGRWNLGNDAVVQRTGDWRHRGWTLTAMRPVPLAAVLACWHVALGDYQIAVYGGW